MRYSYNKGKLFMYFSFSTVIIIFLSLFIINYNSYKMSVKAQKEIFVKKQYSDVTAQTNAIEEKLNKSINELKFMKTGFITGYVKNEFTKFQMETFLNSQIESEKGFAAAYVIFKDNEKDIKVYREEKALYMAENVLKDSSKEEKEIYVSDFKLNSLIQYIAVCIKINEKTKMVAVYNFRYIIQNFIEKGAIKNYTNYFILDRYGNIVFDYEREIIGENAYLLYSENENIKKQIKNYLEKESGVGSYKIQTRESTPKMVNKISAWNSLIMGNQKIVICISTSTAEIDGIISKLTVQNRFNFIVLTVLFISCMVLIYDYFKIKEEKMKSYKIKGEKERLEMCINESNSIFWEYYPIENKFYFSENFYELMGYNSRNFKNEIESLRKLTLEEDFKNLEEIIAEAKKNNNNSFTFACRIKNSYGKYIWFLNRGKVIKNKNGEIEKLIGFIADITGLKQKEGELTAFKTAVEQSPVSIVMTDTEGKITYANQKFTTLTGYTKEELMGKNPKVLNSNRQDKEFYRNMWDTILAGAVWSGEIINRKKNGELYYEKANIAPITDENKKTVGYVAVKEDITRQKEAELKMEKFATRDELTGVLNRRAGIEFIEQQIKVADRKEEKFTLIYVDVNNLKYVNDKMGHSYGDSLIVEVCGGIKEEIRSSDIVARLGGDEFIVVMPDCDKKEADIIWRRIIKTFDYLNNNFKREYMISASHGIYEYIPGSCVTVDIILEEADKEMYDEKLRIKAGKLEENNV